MKLKNKKKYSLTRLYILVISLIVVILIAGLGAGVVGYKLYKREKAVETQVVSLVGKQDYLTEKLDQSTDYYKYDTKYTNHTFNYFAIGNSLTLIKTWGRGICSTKRDNDYFNLVRKALKTNDKLNPKHEKVVAYPYNFSPWERASDRNSVDDLLDMYLSKKLDLVTIQLSENSPTTNKLTQDMEGLVNYVHKKAPNAKILIIGDFWDKKKSDCLKLAAKAKKVSFADLSPIIGDKSYQAKVGTVCEGPINQDGTKGKPIKVTKAASTHPGDKGMKYIADAVMKQLNK